MLFDDDCEINFYEDDSCYEDESPYAGTYAHDVADLSDEFIDCVLDGCPEAYWNID